jgi:hypothetical protein
VHAIAGACAVGVAAALLQLLAPWLRQWGSAAGDLLFPLIDIAVALRGPIIWVAAAAVLSLVAASVLVYVALLDD